jgi:hypothetical protein
MLGDYNGNDCGKCHSALKYLRPVDYYRGSPEALLAERKRKLRETAARRSGVNRWGDLIKIGAAVNN